MHTKEAEEVFGAVNAGGLALRVLFDEASILMSFGSKQ